MSGINYSGMIQEMAKEITSRIYGMIKSKSFSDKTFTARVTENVTHSKCRVLYCGNNYTVSTSLPCCVDDFVRVCAPCNNWRELFVVENKTKRSR